MCGPLRQHNERDFDDHHKRPSYILDEIYPPGNESVYRLSPESVIDEYVATTKYGIKHGKLHHRAQPLREAIIVFEEHHTISDFDRLADALESELGIRTLYYHLHRDEGNINVDTGDTMYNFHAHYGFTNLKDGKLIHFDNVKCKKAQDICARELNMQRGEAGSKALALDHREFRVLAKGRAQSKNIEEERNDQIDELKRHNAKLRDSLKQLNQQRSGTVIQIDYQRLKKLKDDQDIEHKEKLKKMTSVVHEATARLEDSKLRILQMEERALEYKTVADKAVEWMKAARKRLVGWFKADIKLAKSISKLNIIKTEIKEHPEIQRHEPSKIELSLAVNERQLELSLSCGR